MQGKGADVLQKQTHASTVARKTDASLLSMLLWCTFPRHPSIAAAVCTMFSTFALFADSNREF